MLSLPQSTKGARAHGCHSPLKNCPEEAATVSLFLFFTFPPRCPSLLTDRFSSKLLHVPCFCLSQSTRGTRAHGCHFLLKNCPQKTATVSLFLFFTFFPPCPSFFLTFLQFNCYLFLLSLSQSTKGTRTHCCHSPIENCPPEAMAVSLFSF